MDKKTAAKIKNKLQYPKILIEMMMKKGVDRNKVPIEFFEDGLVAIDQIVRMLNKYVNFKK